MSFFRVIYVYPAFRTEPLSYIGRTPEKKNELVRRRGAGQVSELWRYICRKLMRLHKWMTCCEKVLLACEVFPQIFVQCRSLICTGFATWVLDLERTIAAYFQFSSAPTAIPISTCRHALEFFFVTMLLQWLTTAFSKVTTTSYNTQWWKTNGRLLHESLTDAFMNWYMHSLSNSPSNSLSNHWTNYFIKSINYFSISWLITELLN